MHTAELEKIKEITVVKQSGGTGTFYFTSKLGRFFNSSREDVPTYDRIEKMELPLIFTNIANPMELRNFIPDSISFICEGKKISAKNQNKSINPRLAAEKNNICVPFFIFIKTTKNFYSKEETVSFSGNRDFFFGKNEIKIDKKAKKEYDTNITPLGVGCMNERKEVVLR